MDEAQIIEAMQEICLAIKELNLVSGSYSYDVTERVSRLQNRLDSHEPDTRGLSGATVIPGVPVERG